MIWQRNIWTGTDLASEGNVRFVRQGFGEPRNRTYLYHAEFWGDYSLKYPVRGPWRKSLAAARKDARQLVLEHG